MSTKYTSVGLKDTREINPFRLSNQYSSSKRPIRIPLRFKNLRSNTKYKIFLQNDEGTEHEDITAFCTPFGKSITDNNSTKTWFTGGVFQEFISDEDGELFVTVKPYATNGVSLNNSDWNKHWQYVREKTNTDDVGRKNFVIVESARVVGATTDQKIKVITGSTYPISFAAETDPKTRSRKVKQQLNFDYIQTFYIDPNKLNGSQTVDLLDVTLYFRNKPDRDRNSTNLKNPGATVAIIDVESGVPVVEQQYEDSIKNLSWSFITPSTDATVQTVFGFNSPVRLETGKFYGIGVIFDDPNYILWNCKKGDVLVGSEELSAGSSKEHRGDLYERTNVQAILNDTNFDKIFTEKQDRDLKFDLHIAEYDIGLASNTDIELVNIDQEFLEITDTTNNWQGSEFVYKDTANTETGVSVSAGSFELTGSGTTFTSTLRKDLRVVLDDGSDKQVVTISGVVSDTRATIKTAALYTMSSAGLKVTPSGQVDHYDIFSRLLFLKKSNATDTLYFDDGDTIVGVDSGETAEIVKVASFPVSVFSSDLDLSLPNGYSLTGTYKFSEVSGSTVTLDSTERPINFFEPNYVRDYEAVIASRSLEARNSGTLFDPDANSSTPDGKSMKLKFDFTFDGPSNFSYSSPIIDVSHVSLATRQWRINNDATNEHTNSGAALSKHISKRLALSEGQEAEDIRVIQNAYRPIGTDIKVYAKILNNQDPDAFDDKNWTELTRISGNSQFSEKDNFEDYREFEYSFPSEIPTDTTLAGTANTSNGSATVTGVGTAFTTALNVGDVIKLYSQYFDENYGYFSVAAINSDTELVLNEPITNNDIVGTGFKLDTVTTPQTAFLNPLNLNIVRYFGSSGEAYDGYSTVAIKTVLLSEDGLITPRVDDNRVISVST